MSQVRDQRLPSQSRERAEGEIALGSPVSAEAQPIAERAQEKTRVSSPSRDAWRRFRRNWAAVVSLAIVVTMVLIAGFAPLLHTVNPTAENYFAINVGPSPQHWFGTDGVGEDLFSRVLFGLRVPLLVGLVGTFITVMLGVAFGVIAGYFGGVVDMLLSRLTDFFFAFPAFLLALFSVALFGKALDAVNPGFGGSGRIILLTIVFSVVSWPALMRFVRSLALSLKENQFIEAARTSGSTNFKIIGRHILPNMVGLILVQAALITVGIIYTETALSIFGLGVQPPYPDLGQMLYDGSQNLGTGVQPGYYAEVVFPAIFLTALMVAFTFIGDGVRDAVDPRMNN